MEQNAENKTEVLPETDELTNAEDTGNTTSEVSENKILIPVKFNKELKQLTMEEATELAQKGMKFNLISADYERIKQMASDEGQSITEFLNSLEINKKSTRKDELLKKCGGNEELANHIATLECIVNGNKTPGFDELKEQFPEIEDISQLPYEVVEASGVKGTTLLDEYLRYKLRQERETERLKNQQIRADTASVGSQKQFAKNASNPVNTEFLKGLWG